jgi:2'-5' RNA ligase
MLLYLAILPPKDVKERVLKIQKKYQKEKIPVPHITLTQPFSLAYPQEELFKDIENVLEKFPAFEIKLHGLGSFDKGQNSVLYVKILSEGVMAEIHRKIATKILAQGCRTRKDFEQEFHLSILRGLDHEKIVEVEQEIKDVKFNDKFIANEVTLFGIKENEPWQVIKSFKLKENG